MDFEKRVYEKEFELNDTDDSIIEYITKNRDDIANISIHSIAQSLYVAPNAIMRTAKKLGYSGFSELKFSIQQEDQPHSTQTAVSKVLERMPQNIVKTLDVIDDVAMQKMIADMHACDKILFVGIGDSVYFCEIFGKYLRCIDKKVEYYAQIHDMEYASKHLTDKDLVIIISASGSVERLVNFAKDTMSRNIKTYCITHYGKKPLSEICTGQLCFWGEKRLVNGYSVTDRSGLMMLVRLIAEEYWKKM